MLKRKMLARLNAWKGNPNKVALLIKGARQVGKTTTVCKGNVEKSDNGVIYLPLYMSMFVQVMA